jgi:ubiquinone biosynthesis protein UbiJ
MRHGIGVIQWAGSVALGAVTLIVVALLTRSFTLSDQISALTGQVAAQNEKVGAVQQVLGERISNVQQSLGERIAGVDNKVTGVQQDLREVKADVRATHDDIAALRASVAAIAAKLGASPAEQPRKPEAPSGQ